MTVVDEPTHDERIEQLTHLVTDARRCIGTSYYERRHAQINRALDDMHVPACTTMVDTDLSTEPDLVLDYTLDRLYARHPGDTGPDRETTHHAIAAILVEFSRRTDAWLAGLPPAVRPTH